MDDRKRRVLQAIIDDYVRTAEPVGSRTVARSHDFGVGSATIRNEMADLEAMGYLEQPHTSAGRIPSDKGYRYYVDWLLSVQTMDETEEETMRLIVEFKARHLGDLLRQSARCLSEATRFLGLATSQVTEPPRVCALKLVPLDNERLLLLLIADDGGVQSKVLQFDQPLTAADLERISRVLTARLRGIAFGAEAPALRELQGELGRFRGLLDEVFHVLSVHDESGERLLVDGATRLLGQPEFQDVAKAQAVLQVLERESFVDELMGVPEVGEGGVGVAIGQEIHVQEMRDCSLVTAIYAAPGRVEGRIGVLGPRRMDYSHVIAVVEGVAQSVTEALGGEEPRGGGTRGPGSRARSPRRRSAG